MNTEEPNRVKVMRESGNADGSRPRVPGGIGSIRLENGLVRAKVCLDQGGMVAELEDLVGRGHVLPRSGEGPPSADSWGIRFHCGSWGGGPLAEPIEHQILEPDDEHGSAVLVLHQFVPGEECSLQAAWAVQPDSARLMLDLSVQNRSLHPRFLPSGIRLHLENAEVWGSLDEGVLVFSLPNGKALVLQSPPHTWDQLHHEGSEWVLTRLGDPLAPLGKVDWTCTLWPLADFGEVWAAGREVAVGIRPGRLLTVRACTPLPSAKVVLNLSNGPSVESKVSLTPDSPFVADLAAQGLEPVEVAVLDPSKRVLARGSAQHPALELHPRKQQDLPEGKHDYLLGLERYAREENPLELWRSARSPFFAAVSLVLLALDASRRGEHQAASERMDAALHRAGDHALYWWVKAALARAAGMDDEGATVYAHSLSPMEPLLRIEGFLSQEAQASQPSELLKPLAERTEAAQDVVAMLFSLGLRQDAAKVAEELLRHRALPLVRIMLAWGLLQVGRFESEVAQHVSVVETLPVEPPYPHRQFERDAVLGLADWAPWSGVLQVWASHVSRQGGG